MKKIITIFLITFLIITSTACGNQEEAESENNNEGKEVITIGCMPLNKEAVEAIRTSMHDSNYIVEEKVFDGNNLPAQALAAGEIDGLILNHKPWLDVFNEENGTNLYMVEGTHYASLTALYSSKHESLEDFPEGARIIISNDPSNMERALQLMENLGFIELGAKTGEFYSLLDIESNPKNLQFIDVETTMTAGGYEDADAVIAFSSVMKNAGYDAFSYLVEDGKSINFPTGLVVQEEDKDEQWVSDIMETMASEEYEKKFNDFFQGAYVLLKDE